MKRAVPPAGRVVKCEMMTSLFDTLLKRLEVTPGGTISRRLFDILSRTPAGSRTLEFGAGLSTLLFDEIGCRHTAIEHDRRWIGRVQKVLTYGSTIVPAPLVGIPPWYDWQPPPGETFDLILIDGPPGNTPRSPGRAGALGSVEHLLAPGGRVFVDDTNRPTEAALAEALAQSLQATSSVIRNGGKSFQILDTPPAAPSSSLTLRTALDRFGDRQLRSVSPS